VKLPIFPGPTFSVESPELVIHSEVVPKIDDDATTLVVESNDVDVEVDAVATCVGPVGLVLTSEVL
jgi:hypothetical protein